MKGEVQKDDSNNDAQQTFQSDRNLSLFEPLDEASTPLTEIFKWSNKLQTLKVKNEPIQSHWYWLIVKTTAEVILIWILT